MWLFPPPSPSLTLSGSLALPLTVSLSLWGDGFSVYRSHRWSISQAPASPLSRFPATKSVIRNRRMREMGMFLADAQSIISEIKHQDKQLKLKRRWLMGLATSDSKARQQRDFEFLVKHRSLPESFLREDDVFYETITGRVENSFGACHCEKKEDGIVSESNQSFDKRKMKKIILSCLDTLTNKGLYKIAVLLTRGSMSFEKTRWKLNKVIKESLDNDFQNRDHKTQKQIYANLSLVLNEKQNFRENCELYINPSSESHRAAAIKILNELEELPFQTIFAMHRKLRGIQGVTPRLKRWRHGRSRDQVINQVRRYSENLLLDLGKGDHLQERLTKALAIACLSKDIECKGQISSEEDFLQFSPEVKKLQNEIIKAIWLLKTKVRMPELKSLQKLLDQDSDVSNGCLRTAIKNMLIEYLFECSDMDTIPKSFLEAIALINRSSRRAPHKCFPKEEIKEEVECILNVSAQTKQIVLDLVPGLDFERDFDDAYMEELEESEGYESSSDDDGYKDDAKKFKNVKGVDWDLQEGFGESMCVDPETSASKTTGDQSSLDLKTCSFQRVKTEQVTTVDSDPRVLLESSYCNDTVSIDRNQDEVKSVHIVSSSRSAWNKTFEGNIRRDLFSSSMSFGETECKLREQGKSGNRYLAIQEACDETSMVAYSLIGRMLENFANEKGIDLEPSSLSYLKGQSSSTEFPKGTGETNTLSRKTHRNSSNILQVVKELVPSLPKSRREKLKELMSS